MPQKHYRVFFEELIDLLNMEDVFKTLQKMSMRSITRKAKKYAKMFPMEPVFIITLEPEDVSSVEIAGIQQKSLPSLEKLRTLVSGMNVIRPDHVTLLLLRTWNVRSGVNIGGNCHINKTVRIAPFFADIFILNVQFRFSSLNARQRKSLFVESPTSFARKG